MNTINYNINFDKKLLSANKDTEYFSLKNKMKKCKIVDVYDGDSCKAVFFLNKQMYKWDIRLNGYDSPEIRPRKNIEDRDKIIAKAISAKNYLKSLIMNDNQLVYIKCGDFDKYGRVLGTIFIKKDDQESVNDKMIKMGHGYVYHGGTKLKIL